MIGTTCSRVCFFMNRFRKVGLIEYNGRIRIHKSLLNFVLHDQLPEQSAKQQFAPTPSQGRLRPDRGEKSALP
jgi:hypothetical protein